MKTSHFSQWFHTLRHLRPVQIANRIQRKLIPARFPQLAAPPVRTRIGGSWCPTADRSGSLLSEHELQVFQQRISLDGAAVWNNPKYSHLVLYNLHYFDDLASRGADARVDWQRRLIDRWIAENLPGKGVGWEPYPLSLRIVNWIKWQLAGQSLSAAQLDSLATQVAALPQLLEYHLLANHLLANAKALMFAGAFFSGPMADRWLQQGSQILREQVAEQVLPDGGHFELSPMYHSIILEDLLDIRNLARAYPDCAGLRWTEELEARIGGMRSWLAVMSHPDGQIAFFNDAAQGIAAAPGALDAYAQRLGYAGMPAISDGISPLSASGYIRLQRNGTVAILDVAEVGPSYQPGHAHADTLSYELSRGDQRIVVNSGTSCYGTSAERLRQRSTAAHSTVEVDGQNSSEVWSGFRVARRAHPLELVAETLAGQLVVRCGHTGYRRLPGRVTPRRSWRLADDQFVTEDVLEGRFSRAVARTYLHPSITCRASTTGQPIELRGLAEPMRFEVDGGVVRPESTTYHPRFEVAEANLCLVTSLPGPRLIQRLLWT